MFDGMRALMAVGRDERDDSVSPTDNFREDLLVVDFGVEDYSALMEISPFGDIDVPTNLCGSFSTL